MYLYIDAAYFRKVFDDRLTPFLGVEVNPDWTSVRTHFQAARAFYYDSIDDARRKDENETEHTVRLRAIEDDIERISSLDGYFVRLGSVRGDPRRRRQKEVDVLLAVDMLTHSYRGISQGVTLVAGDLDFKPVVEAVVEQGTQVTVVMDRRSGSPGLARAADRQIHLTLRLLWELSSGPTNSDSAELFPRGHNGSLNDRPAPVRTGQLGAGPVYLFEVDGRFVADMTHVRAYRGHDSWSHPDAPKLLQFLDEEYGPISWT